ncbi:type V CRISPR-associated endonuclease Cas1 [Acinetobacter sp. c2-A9]|uniref:type V CRISPR-associated endonuclease Cas1 n=1 Tax=Acinetobacter sp. c2-A9 TaxID=3342802 RepID=UPI0035B980D7
MLTTADIRHRQMVLLNSQELRHLSVSQGNIVVKDENDEVLTKLSRHQVIAILVIGHCTFTSVMIEYCQKQGIALIALNYHLRPIFFASHFSEANFLLRERQYGIDAQGALYFASQFVHGKINGHLALLKKIRKKDDLIQDAMLKIDEYQQQSLGVKALDELMGIEGNAAKMYFKAYFSQLKNTTWQGRKPRLKLDEVNVVLDIGYTLLFNYIECNLRLFGFDVYKGLLHQLWFKRKSLVCDLVEPFRCIIDKQVLLSFNLGQFKVEHFTQVKHQYQLNIEYQKIYYTILMKAIIDYKQDIFVYIRDFYRVFMQYHAGKNIDFPLFDLFNQIEGEEEE